MPAGYFVLRLSKLGRFSLLGLQVRRVRRVVAGEMSTRREKRRTSIIHSTVACLEGVRNTLRDWFVPSGAGYGPRRAFAWREIKVFKNRVLMEPVFNSDYIESRQFLEDAKYDN